MDKSKAAADAVKLINQAKEDSNLQPLMIKAVCSFFDIMKGKELSQADRLFLHYLANQAGLPQYYYPMLNVGEYVDEEVTLQTFSNYINESSLIAGEGVMLHRYQKELLERFKRGQRNRIFLSASTSFGKTFLIYEIVRKMEYTNVAFIFPTLSLLSENLFKIHLSPEYKWVKDNYVIHTLSDKEDDVVTALLRNYGGLFSDFGYIDESYIAQEVGLDRNQIYMVLVNLSKKNIINFIPRKNIPLVSYTQDRIDGDDVVLSEDVYEDRKEQFIKRINSVINYAQNERVCRSRQLLSYFGETKSKDCEQCDVCLSHTNEDDTDEKELIRQQLMTFLSDGQKHLITDIRQLNDNWDLLQKVMRDMVLEEEILMDGSFLLLS